MSHRREFERAVFWAIVLTGGAYIALAFDYALPLTPLILGVIGVTSIYPKSGWEENSSMFTIVLALIVPFLVNVVLYSFVIYLLVRVVSRVLVIARKSEN